MLFIVLALTLIAGIGTSGYVDLSGLPFSVPVALEHCAVRQQGTNVIVHYQGIDAASACRRAGFGWTDYSGPPLGSLACYQQRVLGLSWRVYDTGAMTEGSEVCGRLSLEAQTSTLDE